MKDYRFDKLRPDFPIAVKTKRDYQYQYFCFKTKRVLGLFNLPVDQWATLLWDSSLNCPVYIFKNVLGIGNNHPYAPLPRALDVVVPVFLLPPNCCLTWRDDTITFVGKGVKEDVLYSGLFGDAAKEAPYFIDWSNCRGYGQRETFRNISTYLIRYEYLMSHLKKMDNLPPSI